MENGGIGVSWKKKLPVVSSEKTRKKENEGCFVGKRNGEGERKRNKEEKRKENVSERRAREG